MHAEQPGDEGALVNAVQRGDGDAFAELFRRHYPAVHRACSKRLSDPVEADEVAQAAFVRAYERIDQCVGDRRFGPWVHVIARSICMDAFRAQARVQPWEQPPTGRPEHRANEPEESVLSRERAAQVQEALSTLPDSQRLAVVARDWDELGPGEIADRLGLSVGAVDSLLLRGRRRLALAYRRLAGEGGGGATVLPVRSAVATIALALAVAPQAVMAGTAAAAQAVQNGASRAAGGVVGAVVSLALGITGTEAPAPPPVPDTPPAITTVVVTAESPPPLRISVAPPAAFDEATPAAVAPAPPGPGPEPARADVDPPAEVLQSAIPGAAPASFAAKPADSPEPAPTPPAPRDRPAPPAPVPAPADGAPPVDHPRPEVPPVAVDEPADAPSAAPDPAPDEGQGSGKGKGNNGNGKPNGKQNGDADSGEDGSGKGNGYGDGKHAEEDRPAAADIPLPSLPAGSARG